MSNRLHLLTSHLHDSKPTRIVEYRTAYPLDRNEVRNFIYGEKYRKIVDDCFDVMIKNRHVFQHPDIEDYQRPQHRQRIAKMVLAYHKLRPVNILDFEKDQHAISVTSHASYQFQPELGVRCDITLFLYGKSIYSFSRRGYQPHQDLILRGITAKDIGCFGLTEIGHGSNTKDLQTEATYDHATRSFVFNTPTDTAFKFWIGGASEIANMAVIWAQLIIKGKKYGVHPFAVPIRDRKTMQVLDGVLIADCGAKFGMHGIDNGKIGFRNYRVPYTCMLDRIAGVDQDGNFITIEDNLQRRHGMYMGALSLGRAFITTNSLGFTCNALNIGLKYSCVRRQFEGPSKEEQLIIDYPVVRHKLMPMIANAYIFFIVGSEIVKLYDHNTKEVLRPKSKLAAQLHAISAAAKGRSSWFALETIGAMRHLLGGHGYSSYSRLGRMYYDQDVNVTWQGDNHLLLQQACKYILKQMQKIRQKPDENSLFNFVNTELNLPEKWTKGDLLQIKNLKKIYQTRLQQTNNELVNYMMELKGQNMSDMDVWNTAQTFLGKKVSLIFNDLYYLTVAESKINALPEGKLKEITLNCLRLWLCHELQANRWGIAEDRKILQEIVLQLCQWLTPRSISLVEAFSAPEQIIGSPFADKNGDKMWQKYLNLIYNGKDVFSKVHYYQDIVRSRHQDLI